MMQKWNRQIEVQPRDVEAYMAKGYKPVAAEKKAEKKAAAALKAKLEKMADDALFAHAKETGLEIPEGATREQVMALLMPEK